MLRLALLLACLGLWGCGGDDAPSCTLTCGAQSTMLADVPTVSLSCGTSPVNCTMSYDQFGRITTLSCRYANAKVASCNNVQYNNIGQITGGTCTGEGITCKLP